MTRQLILCKRLMLEGESYACCDDPISSGISISLFQDSIEMAVWAIVKKNDLQVKDGSSFTTNIDLLSKNNIGVPHKAKILELNKARVNFKHYGLLPDLNESKRFQIYAEDFLRHVFLNFFEKDYDNISLVDLVPFKDVAEKLKDAEIFIRDKNFNDASVSIGIAKEILFSYLDKHLPHINKDIKELDILFRKDKFSPSLKKPFEKLVDYLEQTREHILVSMFRLNLQDYTFIKRNVPKAIRVGTGEWKVFSDLRMKTKEECKKAINCIVNLSIKVDTASIV